MSDLAAKYKIPPELDQFIDSGFLEFLSEKESEKTVKYHIPSIAWTDDEDRWRIFFAEQKVAVRQTANGFAVWPAASLANAASAFEPHVPTDLRPVDRIEPAHLSPDRHHSLRSPCRQLVC